MQIFVNRFDLVLYSIYFGVECCFNIITGSGYLHLVECYDDGTMTVRG